MKSLTITPYSKQSRRTQSETADNSCYFPGCRKDANCNCEICLASINATLDLMPTSIQKSSLTKLSTSKSTVERTPIPFKRSILSTPVSQVSETPPLKSTAKSNFFEKKKVDEKEKKKKKRKTRCGGGFDVWRFVVGLSLVFALDSGFSWVVSEICRPNLSAEMVRKVGEENWVGGDLNEKLGVLQKHLERIIEGEVYDCSSIDSNWELIKDGLLVRSRCTLYKSTAEEVSIWGWPLQTSGLLTAGFSSRLLTVLSGRLTEWPSGKTRFKVHEGNSSLLLERLRASAVQMDPSTWVLEYRQNSILENLRLSSAALEFMKVRMLKVLEEVKQQILLLTVVAHEYAHQEETGKRPT